MDEELVLLTSYFNLTGGRRQDNADTFRVEPNVHSGTSGDGTAAVYIVTESSASGQMGSRARRRAADVVVWEYSSRGEEQPATRIKAALRAAHEVLINEFDGHVAVGATVMVVEEDTVYLGQVAPAQVYVVHEGGLHSMSAQVEGSSVFAHALGSSEGPHISVFRDQIGPEDVVTLCSSWFHRGADANDLRACFGAGTAEDIAECLLDLAKEHDIREATGVVVEAVPGREFEAQQAGEHLPSFMEQVDVAVQALANVGRMLLSELRVDPITSPGNGHDVPEGIPEAPAPAGPSESEVGRRRSGGARPVARAEDVVEAPRGKVRDLEPDVAVEPLPDGTPPRRTERLTSREGRLRDQATDEVPIVLPRADEPTVETAPPSTSESPATPRRRSSGARPIPREPAVEGTQEREARSDVPDASISELDQVNLRIQDAPDMGNVIPPVQAFPEASTEPERIYASNKDVQAANRRPRRFGGIAGSGRKDPLTGAPVLRPGIADLDLTRPTNRPAPPTAVWFGVALVFVLAVGAIALFLRHPHGAAANPYPKLVSQDLKLARTASSTAAQDLYLAKAQRNLRLAQVHGASAVRIANLRSSLQSTTDTLHHITRVASTDVQMLADFNRFPNAQPTEVATSPGIVFVLDAKRKSVFSIVQTSAPSMIVQAGDQLNGFTVGTPVHIATDGTTALVLDDRNTLVRDTAGTKDAISLMQAASRQNIVAMGSAHPDVYLLDTASNQVWRYPFAVSAFNTTASGYFTPNTPKTPNLSHALSFALDGTDMYILQGNGNVEKYDIQANPQRFALHLRQPLQKPSEIFTDRGLNYLWITDPPTGRIVQLDKSGNYVRTYVSSTNGMRFDQVRSFAVGPAGNSFYLLSGSKLFKFPVVR